MNQTEYGVTVLLVIIFIVLDIVTGWLAAIRSKNIDSTKLRTGLWHKLAYVFAIALSAVIEWAFLKYHISFGIDVPILIPVSLYIAVTEISSIIENIAIMNPYIVGCPIFSLFARTKEANKKINEESEEYNGISQSD